jgi:hypothetical protein
VKKHLFDETYDKQKTGLINALKGAEKTNGRKLKKAEINRLVKYCIEENETDFEKYLENLIR